jgi:hypothetical protein
MASQEIKKITVLAEVKTQNMERINVVNKKLKRPIFLFPL